MIIGCLRNRNKKVREESILAAVETTLDEDTLPLKKEDTFNSTKGFSGWRTEFKSGYMVSSSRRGMQVVGNGERGRECFGGYVEVYIVVLKALVWSLYYEDTWKYTLRFLKR